MDASAKLLNGLRSVATSRMAPAGWRYPIALAALAMIAPVQFRLFGSSAPWFIYTPVVVLLTLFLGTGPGILSTAVSALLAGYVVAHTGNPYILIPAHWAASIVFVLTTLGLVGLVAALRRALLDSDALRAARERDYELAAEREAFLAGVLASSTDCIKVLDLEGRLTFMSEGGQAVMEVSDFNEIAGCPWPDFWTGGENAEANAAIAAAREGRTTTFVGRAETFRGRPKWWNVAVSPILGADGRPERILSVSRDITAMRESEERSSQLARIVENSRDFIGIARLDGSVFFLNDAAHELVGLSPGDATVRTIADFFPPEEAAIVAAEVLPEVDRTGSWVGERLFRHFGTGELIPVLYRVIPVHGPDGALVGYGTVTRDLRERKRAEEQQRLLNNELAHRLKNVLTVVQSVASQTLRQAPDLRSANDALGARLMALGEAMNVLTAGSWTAANLRSLVERALAPHGEVGTRFLLSGPDLTLQPQVGLAFALALHELATNAAKYGALSVADGHVELSWGIVEGSNGGEPRFELAWREVGGPPVTPPARRGFGSTMIERSLRAYFRGEAVIAYPARGVQFTLGALLRDAVQPAA